MKPEVERDILGRKPYLRALFAASADSPFRLSEARSGAFVILRSDGSALASKIDPAAEAERMLPAGMARLRGAELIFIFGAANPVVLDLVEPLLAENQICVMLEEDSSLASFAAQNHPSLEKFLMRPGSHLFTGVGAEEYLWHYLDSIPADRLTGVRVIRNMASVRRAPAYYEDIEARIKSVVRSRISDLLTRFEFERIWIRNTIRNTCFLPPADGSPCTEHPGCLEKWKGNLSDMPAVLVSAGPSLAQSLPLLRELSQRAFILACDTAFKALRRGGVPVHGVVTLDAQKHSQFHFLGEDLSRTILFADMVSDPSLLRRVKPRGLILSITARAAQSADGSASFETTAGSGIAFESHGPVGFVQSGGSVATSAFDLLRQLGASSVYFVGQDLAYTGRRIHSVGTHHQERWLTSLKRTRSLEAILESVIRKRDTFQVPAIGGGEILTDYVLSLYRHWFEDSIPRGGIPAWNLTREGAVVKNLPGLPGGPDDVLELLPVRDDIVDRWNAAEPPMLYRHDKINRIAKRTQDLLKETHEERMTFLAGEEPLRPLLRRGEVYKRRNLAKLGEERARLLEEKDVKEAVEFLARGLKGFH